MRNYLIIIVLAFFFGCKNGREFPKVADLSNYPNTEFLPTLENKINVSKNAVYCVTLLYAWNEMRQRVGFPIQIDTNQNDLTLINRSKTYIDCLKPFEYSVSGQVNGDLLTIKADFKKSLPFEREFTCFTNELIFNNEKVASFGTYGYDYLTSKMISILYYKNDENFIIKLQPKDSQHEILLFKSGGKYKTMIEMLFDLNEKLAIGSKEKKNENLSWKYYIIDGDIVVIPKIKFNIETNYETMEGAGIGSGGKSFLIETAYQRTAFILDEKGAEISSEAALELAVEIETDKPKPKRMRFDKPFFMILKRTDSEYPYLEIWITNTELMIKE